MTPLMFVILALGTRETMILLPMHGRINSVCSPAILILRISATIRPTRTPALLS